MCAICKTKREIIHPERDANIKAEDQIHAEFPASVKEIHLCRCECKTVPYVEKMKGNICYKADLGSLLQIDFYMDLVKRSDFPLFKLALSCLLFKQIETRSFILQIRQLIRQCDTEGLTINGLVPMYHCMHTPGGPLQYSLEGHPFAPFGVGITSNAKYLISVSNIFIIWDLTNGDVYRQVSNFSHC